MEIQHILVVEDDNCSSIVLKYLIEDILPDINIVIKENGEDAINYLKELYVQHLPFPQLIFLDLDMPKISGYEFVILYEKQFRKYLSSTHLVVLTSSVRSRDKEILMTHPSVIGYFNKPLLPEQLIAIKESVEQVEF